LFLTPAELDEVAGKLTDAGIRAAVERNRALLEPPQSFGAQQLVQFDPFTLAPIFIRKFQSAGGGFRLDASSGYYASSDHTMVLMLMKPKQPAQDVPFAKSLMAGGALVQAGAPKKF